MPSSLQSRGFEVNVMPGYQLANPANFNAGAPLAQGLASGMNMGAQLQDIILRKRASDAEAQMQPLRQQVMMQQLSESRQAAPLRQQLMEAELAGAQQRQHLTDIEMPGREIAAKEPIRIKQSEFLDLDDQGNLAKFGSFKIIDPMTQEVGYQPRAYLGTVKTKSQLEEEKLNNEAMRTYRQGMGNAAQQKAYTAQQIADWKAANPTVKTKTFNDAEMNVYEQVINPDGSLGQIVQVILPDGSPAKRPQSELSGFAGALAGLSGAKPGAAQAAVAAPATANMDALGNLANQFAAPVTIQTKAQYDALPIGASYVDAVTGTRHVKGK